MLFPDALGRYAQKIWSQAVGGVTIKKLIGRCLHTYGREPSKLIFDDIFPPKCGLWGVGCYVVNEMGSTNLDYELAEDVSRYSELPFVIHGGANNTDFADIQFSVAHMIDGLSGLSSSQFFYQQSGLM